MRLTATRKWWRNSLSNIPADAGFVGNEDLKQGQVNMPCAADVRAHCRVQREFWRRQIARFQGTEVAKDRADGPFGARLNARPAGNYR